MGAWVWVGIPYPGSLGTRLHCTSVEPPETSAQAARIWDRYDRVCAAMRLRLRTCGDDGVGDGLVDWMERQGEGGRG